jgi:hypothetical protein
MAAIRTRQPVNRRRLGADRQRGAVMIEMVLLLPILALILSLLLFGGWAAVRLHQASVVDRYEAWRRAAQAPGPGARSQQTGQLNDAFFERRAQRLEETAGPAPDFDSPRFQMEAAGRIDGEAGQFARRLDDRRDPLVGARFKASHEPAMAFWRWLDGPIRHGHHRFGEERAFVDRLIDDGRWYEPAADQWNVLRTQARERGQWVPTRDRTQPFRDQFLTDLDRAIRPLATRNHLARTWRDYYMSRPRYRGPELPENW